MKALVKIFVIALATLSSSPLKPSLSSNYGELTQKIVASAMVSNSAWDRLAEFCDSYPHRLSGSADLEAAIDWVVGELKSSGLTEIRKQPVMVPHWIRNQEDLTLSVNGAEEPLELSTLGMSVGTPAGGIEAQAVVVKSFTELDALPSSDVAGKIVVFNAPYASYGETVRYRISGADRASARGAIAVLIRSVASAGNQPTSPHTGTLSYSGDVARIPAAALSFRSIDRLQRLWDERQAFTLKLSVGATRLPDALSHNVIAEIKGSSVPEEIVVLGGHIDGWDIGQGAHDDGGAIIATMEAIKLLHRMISDGDIPQPRRTLRMVHWTNEENGGRGSQAYFASLSPQDLKNHVAAIEMDGGAEEPYGFGFTASGSGLSEAKVKMQEILGFLAKTGAIHLSENGGSADTGNLINAGVPGLAVNTVMRHYFDWHHSAEDTKENVRPEDLQKHVSSIAALVYVLADMPTSIRDIAEGPRPSL